MLGKNDIIHPNTIIMGLTKIGDECLNEEWFMSIEDARAKIIEWKLEYNSERPHSGLGGIPPYEFIRHIA